MSGSVCVLTPTGRRQIVKVTPNTSILQILEDVCKKHGFSANDYDLKHHNKILDLSNTVRFSNLSNNAQLELVKSAVSKSDSSVVTIGLQLSDGERCFSDYDSNETLWNVLEYWTKQGKEGIFEVRDDDGNVLKPVCIYMRREIGSEEELKKTTLRSLGLVSGKAILRLIHRLPNAPVEQAHVEDLILRRPKEDEEQTEKRRLHVSEPSIETCDDIEPSKEKETVGFFTEPSTSSSFVTQSNTNKPKSQTIVSFESAGRKLGNGRRTHETVQMEVDNEEEEEEEEEIEFDGQLNYLDDSGSVLYNMDEVPKPIDVEIPDEFFEVTMDDFKQLMADLKQQRMELEDIPLKTSAMRDAEYLTRLNKYPKSVVRVHFPDRLALQGCFKSTDKVGKIIDFVRQFLVDKNEDFQLFTVPPKCVLNAEQRLFEVPLTPTGIVHFGSETPLEEKYKLEVLEIRTEARKKEEVAMINDNVELSESGSKPIVSFNRSLSSKSNSFNV